MIATRPLSRRDAFLATQLDTVRRAGGFTQLEAHSGGYKLDGRPYVALPCHCTHRDCPGFAMVRDDPGARHHFNTLFGASA